MGHSGSSQRVTQALLGAQRHWHARHRAETASEDPTPPFVIALSREVGALGTSVGRAVAERLGWPVYDRELLQHIAEELGVRTELLESVDERRLGWLQECVQALAAVPTVSTTTYVRHLVEALMSLASHGECVIVGRGAAQILPVATTLRVRLVAPLKERIRVIEMRKQLSADEAAPWIAKTEAERVQFVKEHFHKDPTDPALYDLVLNSARFDIGKCVDLIIEALDRLPAPAVARRAAVPK